MFYSEIRNKMKVADKLGIVTAGETRKTAKRLLEGQQKMVENGQVWNDSLVEVHSRTTYVKGTISKNVSENTYNASVAWAALKVLRL